MRLAVAATVLALLMAGCAAPTDGEEDDPLFGLCPQWAQGPGSEAGEAVLDGDSTVGRTLGPVNGTYLGRPVDLFRVRIERVELNGTLELRATAAGGERLTLRDFRLGDTQMVPVVSVDPGLQGHDIDVFLSPVLQDAPAAPQPVALNWTLTGSDARVHYSVTYHHKVCGA